MVKTNFIFILLFNFWFSSVWASIDPHEMNLAATTSFNPVSASEVILDNNRAFQSKLEIIDRAQSRLMLVYYIYSLDETSAVFTKKLIQKARAGVKIDILLDYFTNYHNLDLFTFMEKQGRGNIRIHFYNRPTRNIIADALYLTSNCDETPINSSECSAIKTQKVIKLLRTKDRTPGLENVSNVSTRMSGIFLSGIYSQNQTAIIEAITRGSGITLNDLTGDDQNANEELTKLKDLFFTYYSSYSGSFSTRIFNSIKILTAKLFLGKKVTEVINTLNSILPFHLKLQGTGERKFNDWEHLTDFSHHKLIINDLGEIQIGGRNIENSYHMDPFPFSKQKEDLKKYTFIDTDFRFEVNQETLTKMTASFEELFYFKNMVASTEDILKHAPNDFIENIEVYNQAKQECNSRTIGEAKRYYYECVDEFFLKNSVPRPIRESRIEERIDLLANAYLNEYQPKNYDSNLSFLLRSNFQVSKDEVETLNYVENIPFDRNESRTQFLIELYKNGDYPYQREKISPPQRTRQYGVKSESPLKSGKNIHYLLGKSLDSICEDSQKDKTQKRVIIHNAYVIPTAEMITSFKKMVDGHKDCSLVHVDIITNSKDTTDLNAINFFSRHVLKEMVIYFSEMKSNPSIAPKMATFRFFEYQKIFESRVDSLSLHSKVYIIGNDAFIGSANMDIRSYVMDTNNGIYLSNANKFVSDYEKYIDKIIADEIFIKDVTDQYEHTTIEELDQEDRHNVDVLIKKLNVGDFINEKRTLFIKKELNQFMAKIRQSVRNILRSYFNTSVKNYYNDLLKYL